MLVSGLPCRGHAQWLGVCRGSRSFTAQLLRSAHSHVHFCRFDCAWRLRSLPCLSGRYKVSIMVPLCFSVCRCLVVAAHRDVMVTLRTRLLCSRLHHLSRHLPQAHLLLMSLIWSTVVWLENICVMASDIW